MIFVFDFDDSFTFNIYSEIKNISDDVLVINKKFHTEYLEKIKKTDLLVLGPGPGSPLEYSAYFPKIREFIANGYKIWGICLGHQIIGCSLGLHISRCKKPLHGHTKTIQLGSRIREDFLFSGNTLEVQSYNSLSFFEDTENAKLLAQCNLKTIIHHSEVEITYKKNLFTCQFHPESVGTSYRKELFRKILSYLL